MNNNKRERPKRIRSWISSIPGGLTLAAPIVDRLALDGLISRALVGFRELTRAFWELIDKLIWFELSDIVKDSLTITILLLLPALVYWIWNGCREPVADGYMFDVKTGLFRNSSMKRYLILSTAFLAMIVFLNGAAFPITVYVVGAIIVGFSSMIAWKAPITLVTWASTFIVAALFEDRVRPIVERYFESIGI